MDVVVKLDSKGKHNARLHFFFPLQDMLNKKKSWNGNFPGWLEATASGLMCSESQSPLLINQQFGKCLLQHPRCFCTHLPGTTSATWTRPIYLASGLAHLVLSNLRCPTRNACSLRSFCPADLAPRPLGGAGMGGDGSCSGGGSEE